MNEQRGGHQFQQRLLSQKEAPEKRHENALEVIMNCFPDMYHANTLAKSRGNRVEDVHRRTDPFHQLLIGTPKLIKYLSLMLNYVQDGLDGVASLQFLGDPVV